MPRKILFNAVICFLILVILSQINYLYAQTPGMTVYLRNISGYSIDFCLSGSTTPGTQWYTIPNNAKNQFWIAFGQYFHYRYTGGSQFRYIQVGSYPYVAAWWKFKPGPYDPGVTTADGGITLLNGPTFPLLEGDPEMASPNVALQPTQQMQPAQPLQPPQPPQPPAVTVEGQIGVVWRYLGGPQSPLGNPTSGELPATPSFLGTRGNYRNFSGGQVIWHAVGTYTGQAFAVYGAIGSLYVYMGGTASRLGFPLNNEMNITPSPYRTTGRWQPFEGGLIVWHANGRFAGRAYSVEGAIAGLYQSYGGTGSWLGMPLSFEYDWNGGRRSDFEGGYIFWTREAGARAFYYNSR